MSITKSRSLSKKPQEALGVEAQAMSFVVRPSIASAASLPILLVKICTAATYLLAKAGKWCISTKYYNMDEYQIHTKHTLSSKVDG